MSHDTGAVCRCAAEHRPPVLEYQRHHVLPLAMGGPDTPENVVWLCPTAHVNVHEILRLLLRDGPLTATEIGDALADRPVSRYATAIARDGLAAVTLTLNTHPATLALPAAP